MMSGEGPPQTVTDTMKKSDFHDPDTAAALRLLWQPCKESVGHDTEIALAFMDTRGAWHRPHKPGWSP